MLPIDVLERISHGSNRKGGEPIYDTKTMSQGQVLYRRYFHDGYSALILGYERLFSPWADRTPLWYGLTGPPHDTSLRHIA